MKKYLVLLVAIFVASCNLDSNEPEVTYTDYSEINDTEIQSYLDTNSIVAVKSESGLYYSIDEVGTGEQPTANSDVTVAYKGYFLDGTVFDESDAEGISFNLQQVIIGWSEGMTYFNEGGSGRLFIPAHLGYGSLDYNGIPAGSVLIFDVALLAVN